MDFLRVSRLLWLVALSPVWGLASSPPLIRVGLIDQASAILLGPGDYRLEGPVLRATFRPRSTVPIRPTQTGFSVEKMSWGKQVVLGSRDPKGVVWIQERPYRGVIRLERVGSGIRVVNELTVEDYVRGILQMETSDRWPQQALLAQAVISRTYALRNRGRHGRLGYDFCPTPHCQVYGGARAERARTDAAVQRTRGEVLVDRRRRLISAVFHSSCGGRTEAAENVWENGGQPYLRSVRCPWCKDNPHNHWVATLPFDFVDRRLRQAGLRLGPVRALGILSHTRSGRVHLLRLYGEKTSQDINANRFRLWVDPQQIRSTLWAGLSRREGAWRIHGNGWGHGVGLCQWGMKGLAEKKLSYGSILRIYYSGVEVADWDTLETPSTP